MTREEIRDYIKEELTKEDPEIYLDIDDYKVILEALSVEPCKNAVSRDAVQIDLKRELLMNIDSGTDDYYLRYSDVCDEISKTIDDFVENLPPIQPKIPYPSYCGEDCRCDEGGDGKGCPYLNQNEECIIELLDR